MSVIALGLASISAADSVAITANVIRLVNDSATPGASRFYGTDSGGVRGWFALTAGSVTTVAGTAGQVLVNGGTAATSGAVTLTLATALVSINSVTSVAGQPLVLATGSSGTAVSIASATNIATFSAGIAGTTVTLSTLTSGRVPFASTGGLLIDDSDFTFSTDTLTVTKATIGSITHVANAIGAANSVTSAAGQALVLATGTSGTALTIASATNTVTFGGLLVATATGQTLTIGITTGTSSQSYIAFQGTTAGAASRTFYAGVNVFATDGSFELKNTGGLGIGLAVTSGNVAITSVTASTSTTTGALVVSGGLGVAGATNIGGVVGIGIATASSIALSVAGSLSGSTSQYGVASYPTFGSGATSQANVFYGQLVTAAASFSVSNAAGIQIDVPSIGAGSSIGTLYGLRIGNQSGASTNYAIFTGSGLVKFGDTTVSSSTTTGALVVSGGVGIAGVLYVGGDAVISNGSSSRAALSFVGSQASAETYVLQNQRTSVSNTGFEIRNSTDSRSELTFDGAGNVSVPAGSISTIGLTSTVANAVSVTARSGASGSYTGISIGRTADEAYFGIAANTNDWTQGAVAGDAVVQTASTTRKIHFDTNAGSTTASITIGAANGPVTINNTTSSISTTTGALVVGGGVGITGDIYASGSLLFSGGLTGGVGGMTINAGVGNSLTIRFRTTNGSGTLITALTLNADQSSTFASTVITPASTTSVAGLRILAGTAPSSPTNGDVWQDGVNFKIQIGGVTKTVTLT